MIKDEASVRLVSVAIILKGRQGRDRPASSRWRKFVSCAEATRTADESRPIEIAGAVEDHAAIRKRRAIFRRESVQNAFRT